MKSIIKNEFSEIACSASGNIIYQCWYKASVHLSEWEFLECMDTLCSTAEVFKSKVLYIDALDFGYPIMDKSMQQIKKQFEKCEIEQVGMILNADQLGAFQFSKLIETISLFDITTNIFNTREQGESWLSLAIPTN